MDMPDHFRKTVKDYEGADNITCIKTAPPPPVIKPVETIPIKTNYNHKETLRVGLYAECSKRFEKRHVERFATLSEDFNPLHLDDEFAKSTRFGKTIVHGHLVSSLFSGLVGGTLPGSGSIYLGQTTQYKLPAFVGDVVHARVEISSIDEKRRIIKLRTTASNDQNKLLIDGEATIMVPQEKIGLTSKL
jgi:3-hydroxybutyryl-CoA dehydratase/enoyl-CoA hydratase